MRTDILRLCRLGGLAPRARDRWRAFFSLWRMASRHSAQQAEEAGGCFRVLMFDWSWVQLVQAGGDELEGLRFLPRWLRWRRLGRCGGFV